MKVFWIVFVLSVVGGRNTRARMPLGITRCNSAPGGANVTTRPIMRMKPMFEVIGLTDIELALGTLKNVDPKHTQEDGSRERARTSNPPVNPDRSGLYH